MIIGFIGMTAVGFDTIEISYDIYSYTASLKLFERAMTLTVL